MKRISCFFLLLILLLGVCAQTVSAETSEESAMNELQTKSYYREFLTSETEYVKQLVLSCGAVGMYRPAVTSYSGKYLPDVNGISASVYSQWKSAKVMPYFSDAAILGIMEADRVLGTAENQETALNYINWYLHHMNTAEEDVCGVAGTVYDYIIFQSDDGRTVELTTYEMNSQLYPTGNPYDYDSTDSYAAMFLELLLEYTEVYDSTFLDGKEETVNLLLGVLNSTFRKSCSLTIAKPNYAMCYLMDNCEVYRGLISAQTIYADYLKNAGQAETCRSMAEQIRSAILSTLWDETDQCFLAAVSPNGKPAYDNDLTVFYPQATCQLYPAVFGVLSADDEKAVQAYRNFTEQFLQEGILDHDWAAGDTTDEYPWCILLRAAVLMKDYGNVRRFLETVRIKYVQKGHPSPYYCYEAGNLLIAVAQLYSLAEDDPAPESTEEAVSASTSEESTEENHSMLKTIAAAAVAFLGIVVAALLIRKKKKSAD